MTQGCSTTLNLLCGHDTRAATPSQCFVRSREPRDGIDPAHGHPMGGVYSYYRPAVRVRQPHWQLVCPQRQALAWHPHEQAEQSQVPQQLVLAIFCEADFFTSVMVQLLCDADA